jgi:hypothetical protein
MRIALTHEVSPHIDRCQLTHLERVPIDHRRCQQQHRAYCEVLTAPGLMSRCTIPRGLPRRSRLWWA